MLGAIHDRFATLATWPVDISVLQHDEDSEFILHWDGDAVALAYANGDGCAPEIERVAELVSLAVLQEVTGGHEDLGLLSPIEDGQMRSSLVILVRQQNRVNLQ